MKYINIIILTIFSFCLSQNNTIINNVKVSGNNNLTDNDILRISRIYEGMEIKTDELQQGIKRLWHQKRFNDVQILLLKENINGISIEIVVEEAPILREIDISGNKKIKAKKIIEVGELVLGQVFTNNRLFDAIDKIKEEYQDRNYHNIQIDYSFLSEKLILLNPGRELASQKHRVDILNGRLILSMMHLHEKLEDSVKLQIDLLNSLSPLSVLNRGYSVAIDKSGNLLRSVNDVQSGEELEVRLQDGTLKTKVTSVKPQP